VDNSPLPAEEAPALPRATISDDLRFPAPPVITSPLSAAATVGQQFVYQFEATEATSLAVMNLPAGLTFDPVLSAIVGIPTDSGTFQVELDAANAQGTTTATLTLDPVTGLISGTATEDGSSAVVSDLRFICSGNLRPYRRLPSGLRFNSVTGIISGTFQGTGMESSSS
jgi:hypothetical protein